MTTSEIDVEDFVIAYLGGLGIVPTGQIAARMPPKPPLPFVLVQRIAGDDDYFVDYPTISIHSFHSTQTAASDIARTVHHAMRTLRSKTPVTLPGGIVVTPYAPTQVELTPIYMEWETGGGGAVIFRYVGRYRLRLRLPTITGF